jgi:hypothetical protein
MSEGSSEGSATVVGGTKAAMVTDGDCLTGTLENLRQGYSSKPMPEVALQKIKADALALLEEVVKAYSADSSFQNELAALGAESLVFTRGSDVLLPEDVAPVLRQALGLDMPVAAARRLFSMLSNSELADALVVARVPASGSKEERVERLVTHRVQPSLVLRTIQLGTLRHSLTSALLCSNDPLSIPNAKTLVRPPPIEPVR